MARTGRFAPGSKAVRLFAVAVLAFLGLSFTESAAHASVSSPAKPAAYAARTGDTSVTFPATATVTSASLASPPPAETSTPDTASCAGSTGDQDWNPYLALDRWSSATSTLHVRLQSLVNFSVWDGFSISNPIAHMTNGALDDWFLNAGDWAWQTNEGLAQTAEQYCAIGRFGGAVDQAAGSLGRMLFNPVGSAGGGIALIIIAGGIIIIVARASRGLATGGDIAKYLLKAGAITGLAFVMIAGAAQTSNQGAGSNTTTFGRGSPGWMLNIVNDAVTQVGSYATRDISPGTAAIWYTPAGGADDGTGPGTCAYFMAKMHAEYDSIPDASQTANAISQMWESSGLLLWVRAQMGAGASTPATDRSFCFIADMMSGIQGSPQGYTAPGSGTSYAAGGSGTFDPAATTYELGGWSAYPVKQAKFDLFNDTASQGELASAGLTPDMSDPSVQDWMEHRIDITGAGYVICAPAGGTWHVDAAAGMNAQYMAAGSVTDGDCRNAYTGSLDSVDASHLNIREGTENQINPYPGGLLDFIGSWHGYNDNGVSLMASLSYMIASLVMLVVFGAISLGVIVAKTILIAAGMFLFFLLLLELNPNGESRLPKFFRFIAACALSTVALSLLLAMIGKITWFVSSVTTGIAGQGSIFSMITYAFAPVVAVAIVHFGFTHLLKLPSPVKISSAMKYAAAGSGGIGASAGSGLESFGAYMKNRAKYGIARRGMRFGRRGLRSALSGGASFTAEPRQDPAYITSPWSRADSGIGTFGASAKRSGAVEAALRRTVKETGDPELTEKDIDKAREDFFANPENQEKIKEKLGEQRQEERRARRDQRRQALVQGMMNAPLRTTVRGAGKFAKTGAKVGLATGLAVLGGPVGAGIVATSVGRHLAKRAYERNRASLARHDSVWSGSEDFQVLQEKVAQSAAKRRRLIRQQASGGQTGTGPLSQQSDRTGRMQQAAARRKDSRQDPGHGAQAGTGPVTGQPAPGVVTPRTRPGQQRGAGTTQPRDAQDGRETGSAAGSRQGRPGTGESVARNMVDEMKNRLPQSGLRGSPWGW